MKHVGYGVAVLSRLKDKMVEVHTGTFARTRKYYDFDEQLKEVIRGILRDSEGELLVLEVIDPLGNSNFVYLNSANIISIIEPRNGISTVDIYIDEGQKIPK